MQLLHLGCHVLLCVNDVSGMHLQERIISAALYLKKTNKSLLVLVDKLVKKKKN